MPEPLVTVEVMIDDPPRQMIGLLTVTLTIAGPVTITVATVLVRELQPAPELVINTL